MAVKAAHGKWWAATLLSPAAGSAAVIVPTMPATLSDIGNSLLLPLIAGWIGAITATTRRLLS